MLQSSFRKSAHWNCRRHQITGTVRDTPELSCVCTVQMQKDGVMELGRREIKGEKMVRRTTEAERKRQECVRHSD